MKNIQSQHEPQPIIEESDMVQGKHMGCVGCGKTENIKLLELKTSYNNPHETRQIIPLCEMCSIDLSLALAAIWNMGGVTG